MNDRPHRPPQHPHQGTHCGSDVLPWEASPGPFCGSKSSTVSPLDCKGGVADVPGQLNKAGCLEAVGLGLC